MRITEPLHIGDGVYVEGEGFHIALAVNHHENKVIRLEDWVARALIRELERILEGDTNE